MVNPRGLRKDGGFKAVSTAPTINKTPVGSSMVPLPYPLVADLSNAVQTVSSVRLNNQPAYVLSQTVQPSCKGDAPGVGKGIRSSTVSGEVKPTKASQHVRVGGKPILRVGDPCTMNGGNTAGIYVAVPAMAAVVAATSGQQPPQPGAAQPEEKGWLEQAGDTLKEAGQFYKDKVSDPLHDFAGQAMDTGGTIAAAGGGTAAVGGVMVATGVGAVPGAVAVTAGGATAAVGGGVATVGGVTETVATGLDAVADFATTGRLPNAVGMATAYAQRMVMSKVDKVLGLIPGRRRSRTKPEEEKPEAQKPQSGAGGDGFSVQGSGGGGDCGIKPYKDQKCPAGQQAHHIVPDYALRYGSRGKGAKGQDRIPGMPSLDDGPSICLTGQAKTTGSEHNAAHEGTDPKIAALGNRTDNGQGGTAPIGDIIDISVEEVSKVKPHCADEIKRKTNEAFKDVDRSKYGRTTQQPPAKGSEARGSLERGDTHTPKDNGTYRRRRRSG